eukprot:TRINITY_DN67080_c6_g10_i1.p1 TRINITY_DN67080_c6_g10~~TRINITY_DN67080_c6_g10_i1.p1  ORF type:complete len:562 (-),score=30.67 TRINITY_DN67080_c6_g10_i1:272-1906(-)
MQPTLNPPFSGMLHPPPSILISVPPSFGAMMPMAPSPEPPHGWWQGVPDMVGFVDRPQSPLCQLQPHIATTPSPTPFLTTEFAPINANGVDETPVQLEVDVGLFPSLPPPPLPRPWARKGEHSRPTPVRICQRTQLTESPILSLIQQTQPQRESPRSQHSHSNCSSPFPTLANTMLGATLPCAFMNRAQLVEQLAVGPFALEFLENHPDIPINTIRDDNGVTPLMLAAKHGDEVAVKLLLDCGADWNMKDEGGFTALHHAMVHNQPAVLPALLERLCRAGEPVPFQVVATGVFMGHTECLSTISQLQELTPHTCKSLFSTAAMGGRVDAIQWLLKQPHTDPSLACHDDTSIVIAASQGHLELVKVLLSLMPTTAVSEFSSNRLLSVAANNEQWKLAHWLVKEGWSSIYAIPRPLLSAPAWAPEVRPLVDCWLPKTYQYYPKPHRTMVQLMHWILFKQQQQKFALWERQNRLPPTTTSTASSTPDDATHTSTSTTSTTDMEVDYHLSQLAPAPLPDTVTPLLPELLILATQFLPCDAFPRKSIPC